MADILLADDDSELLQSMVRALSALVRPLTICAAGSASRARELACSESPQVAVVDLSLDPRDGVESGFSLISELRQADSSVRIIVLTGHGALEHGVQAIALGAAHFVEKPVDALHLAVLIKDAVVQSAIHREHKRLLSEAANGALSGLCGSSGAMRALREQLAFLSTTNQPVLVCGETGVGKGVCARAIHRTSRRSAHKFVHFQPNFGGGDIVQSQLFGHVRGAFTGATESRRGLVVEAHQGTLFIDELDEVPAQTQVALLDVIQEQRVRPIGSDSFQSVDCRFVAATNRPLEEALSAGRIRRDLHHRLAHAVVAIPPLRERRDDIPELTECFLAECRERHGANVFEFSSDAMNWLCLHDWPGNVRELQAVVEGAACYAHFKGRTSVSVDDLPRSAVSGDSAASRVRRSFHAQVEEFKVHVVRESMALYGGNKLKAAEALGLDRGTLRRILARMPHRASVLRGSEGAPSVIGIVPKPRKSGKIT
jgi:DNA-binding NtrC family response regulator